MKLSTLFVINAILALLFGLGFLLIPTTLVSFYGIQLDAAAVYVARLLGAAYLGYAIISWLFQNSKAASEVRTFVLTLFVTESLAFVVSLVYQLQGLANALGWSTVVIFLLMAAGFGYFYWKKYGSLNQKTVLADGSLSRYGILIEYRGGMPHR